MCGFRNNICFIFIGIVLIYLPLLIQKLLAPNNPNPDKQATYECGEESGAQLGFSLTYDFM